MGWRVDDCRRSLACSTTAEGATDRRVGFRRGASHSSRDPHPGFGPSYRCNGSRDGRSELCGGLRSPQETSIWMVVGDSYHSPNVCSVDREPGSLSTGDDRWHRRPASGSFVVCSPNSTAATFWGPHGNRAHIQLTRNGPRYAGQDGLRNFGPGGDWRTPVPVLGWPRPRNGDGLPASCRRRPLDSSGPRRISLRLARVAAHPATPPSSTTNMMGQERKGTDLLRCA